MTQKFLRHAPCPNPGCNSSDGLAIYEDHEHCFVCDYDKQYAKKEKTAAIPAAVSPMNEISFDFFEGTSRH